MSISVACPQCHVPLDVPEDFLGRMVRCAACATAFEAKTEVAAPTSLQQDAGPLPERYPEDDAPLPPRSRRDFDADDYYPDDWDHERGRPLRRDLEPHRGTMVLVFGILSLVLPLACGVPGFIIGIGLGITGAIMGTRDVSRMRKGLVDPDGESQTRVGQILSFVGLGMSVVLLLACGALYTVLIVATFEGKK
jgi:hypothetical protein